MIIEHLRTTALGNKRSCKQEKYSKDFFNKHGRLQIYLKIHS